MGWGGVGWGGVGWGEMHVFLCRLVSEQESSYSFHRLEYLHRQPWLESHAESRLLLHLISNIRILNFL